MFGKRAFLLVPLVATLVSAIPVQIQADGVAIAARSSVMTTQVMPPGPQDMIATPDMAGSQGTATTTPPTTLGSVPPPTSGQVPLAAPVPGVTASTTTGASNSTTPAVKDVAKTATTNTTGSGTQTTPSTPPKTSIVDKAKDGLTSLLEKAQQKFTEFTSLLGGLLGGGAPKA